MQKVVYVKRVLKAKFVFFFDQGHTLGMRRACVHFRRSCVWQPILCSELPYVPKTHKSLTLMQSCATLNHMVLQYHAFWHVLEDVCGEATYYYYYWHLLCVC